VSERRTTETTLAADDARTRESGTRFLVRFYAALRILKLYPVENEQAQKALDELTAAAADLLEAENEIELRMAGEFLFVNSTRLRLGLDNYASFSHVINTLRQCEVGGVHIEPGVERREWQVLIAQLLAVAARTDDEDRLVELENRLRQGGVTRVAVDAAISGDGTADEFQKKEMAKRTYERSVSVTRHLVNSVRMGRTASLRRVKRAVQGIVDQVLDNETSIVGLTTIRDYDDYTFTHSVNVCIFSLSMGKRIGLTKRQLLIWAWPPCSTTSVRARSQSTSSTRPTV